MLGDHTWPLTPDALYAAAKADATWSNLLLMVHQPAMGLLFLKELCRFHGIDAPIADRLARNASFAVALAVERVACHAAILRVAKCGQELATKS